MNEKARQEDRPMSEASREHRDAARSIGRLRVGVVTFSDTRTEDTDRSGRAIRELLDAAGHETSAFRIVREDPEAVRTTIVELTDGGEHDAILTTGGTGLARRDGTFEAVSALLDRTIPGFGELFRTLSFQEIGAPAMLSRAVAGVRGTTPVFCMPGSENAVRLAMSRLIVPELRHLVHQLRH
jgi:molybdenum cofactor biosynthesis protein B